MTITGFCHSTSVSPSGSFPSLVVLMISRMSASEGIESFIISSLAENNKYSSSLRLKIWSLVRLRISIGSVQIPKLP